CHLLTFVCLSGGMSCVLCFFFTDPPPPDIFTLSLHDALPISGRSILGTETGGLGRAGGGEGLLGRRPRSRAHAGLGRGGQGPPGDRKSTRLNSSHVKISYAVFCLKK